MLPMTFGASELTLRPCPTTRPSQPQTGSWLRPTMVRARVSSGGNNAMLQPHCLNQKELSIVLLPPLSFCVSCSHLVWWWRCADHWAPVPKADDRAGPANDMMHSLNDAQSTTMPSLFQVMVCPGSRPRALTVTALLNVHPQF
jgi:hypothetical protein